MIEGKSLFETYFKQKPKFGVIHAFRTVCWVRIPPETRLKDDLTNPKALKGRLLGPNVSGSGHLVLLDLGKIVRSRDVVFKRVVAETPGENEPVLAQEPTEEAIAAQPEPEGAAEPLLEVGQAIGAPDEREATPMVVVEPEQELPAVEAEVEVIPHRSPRFASAHAIYVTLSATFMTGDSDAVIDPLTYKQAMESPEAVYWQKATDSELASVMRAGTWVEAPTPQGRKLVGCKWVYKTKRDASGSIAKYKARIVAQGYSQIEGIDYDETFSPVARLTSLRLLMAVVSSKGLKLHQMDADTAFLNGKLDEEVLRPCQNRALTQPS
jgi:hypothetical protein